ncbi:hypothetical protein QQS21_006349 [Conoideocrella luteorostrata]|uniref:Uncharacterized protein n=1 Tax=Conoideocrella luteorostrata TaxID=1105319 RepID=A0AAJ0FYB6_9HYPO|nr:hypothetical protein QQS21_006349 [Conoideocrella luteorostrata]
MPYIARTSEFPELAISGGLVDPRADHQPSFDKRMACRDLMDFISNTSGLSPLVSKDQNDSVANTNTDTQGHKPDDECQIKLDKILARSKEIRLLLAAKNGQNRYKILNQSLSDLVPGVISTGGLSRSSAFDSLPVVSHWADRTHETSAMDARATIRLTSTWASTNVIAEGATMGVPLGAPCWSLKTHGIGLADAALGKFSQRYDAETNSLETTVALERRPDTDKTAGVLGAAASVSWMRNTRVADAVDCAVGLLADASVLLEARDKVMQTGATESVGFAEVRRVEMPTWCIARKPLPPKLSGVALSFDEATVNLLASEGCEGALLNASIFSMAVGYNRGVYGGSISGLWAIMDSAFVLDYSVGISDRAMADSLTSAFSEVTAAAEASVSAGPHITDVRIIKGCNYGCLRQKTIIEDTHTVPSSPCVVVWNDLGRLARYKLADAVFCHVYYDSGGGEQMAAIAGLGCVAHDWIDLGADVACGEVSNIIPSLTRGSLAEEPLAEVYSRLLGTMIWYRDNDPYNPAATCLLFTHWWQLANCRHRPITLLGRTDLAADAGVAATIPAERPTLEHFRSCGTKVQRGKGPLANAELRLQSFYSNSPLPETHAVADVLVSPVLAYVKGGKSLPSESEYLGAVLAAELAYPHGQKIVELWDLAIVMWESGAMWAAGVAGLCYTHKGNSNCDRARSDLSDATWG